MITRYRLFLRSNLQLRLESSTSARTSTSRLLVPFGSRINFDLSNSDLFREDTQSSTASFAKTHSLPMDPVHLRHVFRCLSQRGGPSGQPDTLRGFQIEPRLRHEQLWSVSDQPTREKSASSAMTMSPEVFSRPVASPRALCRPLTAQWALFRPPKR